MSLDIGLCQAGGGSAFECLEVLVLCPMINLNLFIVAAFLPQPFVWHLTSNRRWLTVVAAADDLDFPVIEPAEEGLQNGPRHVADLVPDNDSWNKLLAHSFRGLFSLTTPAEEAVVRLGLYALSRISLARRWVGVNTRGLSRGTTQLLLLFCHCPLRHSGNSAGGVSAGRNSAAQC